MACFRVKLYCEIDMYDDEEALAVIIIVMYIGVASLIAIPISANSALGGLVLYSVQLHVGWRFFAGTMERPVGKSVVIVVYILSYYVYICSYLWRNSDWLSGYLFQDISVGERQIPLACTGTSNAIGINYITMLVAFLMCFLFNLVSIIVFGLPEDNRFPTKVILRGSLFALFLNSMSGVFLLSHCSRVHSGFRYELIISVIIANELWFVQVIFVLLCVLLWRYARINRRSD
jgi:hypothetical protein